MSTEVKQAVEDLGRAWEEFKTANDARDALVKKHGVAPAELEGKLTKINAAMDAAEAAKVKAVEELKERIDELESKADRPAGGGDPLAAKKAEYKDAFFGALRGGFENSKANLAVKELETKDITIGTGSEGGFAVPEEISTAINKMLERLSPVRGLVKVQPTGSNDYKELVDIRGTTSGWVAETGTRTATLTPALRERAPTMGELYAYPQVSEWSLDDIFFSVEQWLTESVAEAFAKAEGIAVISGNGTNKPTGILNTTPVATSDTASPLRSAEAIEYIDNAVSPAALAADTFFDVVYAMNAGYLAGNVSWAMNRLVQGAARKLKGSDNNYLWAPGLVGGQPSTMLGFPVATWEDLAAVAAGNFPILFGNFNRGYTLADRVGMRRTRDNVTNPGFVRFYIRKRVGGILTNNDAIKA
ncbi:MAG: phage major capsid protein, partial [Planctomycetota bacterium]